MKDALIAPLSVVQSWPKPDYTNPPDRGSALFAVSILLPAIATVLVILRSYVRVFIVPSFGVDDVLLWVSFGFAVAISTLIAYADRVYHMNRHVWDIPPDTASVISLNNFYAEICYMLATTSIKVSVLLFYRRLTVRCSRRYIILVHAGIAYNVLYGLIFVVFLLKGCTPLPSHWLRMNPIWRFSHINTYHCISDTLILPLSGATSVIGDAYATALPFFAMRPMRLTRRQRFILNVIFAVGGTVIVAGFARTALTLHLVLGSYDFTWHALWASWICTQLEIYLSIYCACAPALRPLFGRLLSSTSHSATDQRPTTTGQVRTYGQGISASRNLHRSLSMTDSMSKHEIIVCTEVSIEKTDRHTHDDLHDDLESLAGKRGGEPDEVPLRPLSRRHISACWNGQMPSAMDRPALPTSVGQ